ncbi:MAG: hypothetical protein NTU89_00435 [Candidatus Dependentiae bacterium]|nr:hypothetical protein [Candidatus Dependentiae bacterium]
MLKKSLFLAIAFSASYSQSSFLQSSYQQNPPSPLCQEFKNMSFDNLSSSNLYSNNLSSSDATPSLRQRKMHSFSPSPLFEGQSPISISSDIIIYNEQETREEITKGALVVTATLHQAFKAEKNALKKHRKEQTLQAEIIKARKQAVRDLRELYPSCTLDKTQLCPKTGELFYTRSGITVGGIDDIFERN